MNNQNKARQSVKVAGVADNALYAALSGLNERVCIITKNYKINNFNSNKLLGFGVGVGYSAGSENTGSTPRLNRGFFVPLIVAACQLTRCAFVFGGVGSGQPSTVLYGQSTPIFIDGFKSENTGGSHA